MRNLLVAAWIVVQLALPASYYLRDDPFDERFAWRMFSPVRMEHCQVRVTEGPSRTPVRLGDALHMVWINLLERGRTPVIERFAAHRCDAMRARGEAADVRIRVACPHPDGTTHYPVPPDENLCEGGG